MIKLVSFFIFIAAFVWTWSLFNTKNAVGIDVHAGIQSKLAILIQDSIKSKRPNSSNFAVQKLYTEKMDDNKIKAYFSYRYSDAIEDSEKVDQTISGEAVLSRGLSEDPKVQKWVIQSVKTDTSSIAFQEGLVITSDGKSTVNDQPTETKTEGAVAPTNSDEKKTQ